MNEKYEAVIGLEVHAQLLTDSKLFCGCSAKFGAEPNTNVCPICLGHPGTLPVLNKKVVDFAIMMGLATGSNINRKSVFARKNYFYPDLPKGYQISQYEAPICEHGIVEVVTSSGERKSIGITRIHMEEDAGKSIHDSGYETLVDVNRCGVPLIEIVSEPDMRSAEEAYLYLSKIRQIVQYLGICDGNMEEGSLRCDANISVRLKGETKLGIKTEVKNMNSFRNVERAINYEIERQIDIIEDGGRIVQETLLWNADLNKVFSMRSKEEAHDYRYFPEPDLVPTIISDEWLQNMKSSLPEMPEIRKERFINDYSLPLYDAEVLTTSKDTADYYESILAHSKDFKGASNWVMGEVLRIVNDTKIDIKNFPVSPRNLGKLINLINTGVISGKIAKEVFPEMLQNDGDPESIVKEKGLLQISDTAEIEKIIDSILDKSADEVAQYISGKDKLISFFVGQAMRETKGKANPAILNKILKEKLEKRRNQIN